MGGERDEDTPAHAAALAETQASDSPQPPAPTDQTRSADGRGRWIARPSAAHGVTLPDSAAATAPALPLATVDPDHYARGDELARGGMGRVVHARDRRHDRPVAIKEALSPSAHAHARFEREALITARLQHPAIVPVYEAGRWPNGDPFYAMKLVAGRPLDVIIQEKRSLDERIALLPKLIAVVEAIAYAHGRGVIHRDLKPANILVGEFAHGRGVELDETGRLTLP